MKSTPVHKIYWWVFGILCIGVGLYPSLYFILDRRFALLGTKSQELLADMIWNVGFYGHIVLGGIALLIGWVQFNSSFRKKKIDLHRKIGKVYVFCVLISGICGLYIAQFATGGLPNVIAFSISALFWLGTTFLAYRAIKVGKVQEHQHWMIYSYAVCFSAVTLRIWMPIMIGIVGSFDTAYLIISWLSFVPNIIVAYFIIRRNKLQVV